MDTNNLDNLNVEIKSEFIQHEHHNHPNKSYEPLIENNEQIIERNQESVPTRKPTDPPPLSQIDSSDQQRKNSISNPTIISHPNNIDTNNKTIINNSCDINNVLLINNNLKTTNHTLNNKIDSKILLNNTETVTDKSKSIDVQTDELKVNCDNGNNTPTTPTVPASPKPILTNGNKSPAPLQRQLSGTKKSVSFDATATETVQKFIEGEAIVDQENPFRQAINAQKRAEFFNQKPPIAPRTSLIGKKLAAADEFVTTEDVLKQSKFVKTYIRNPDPYFKYDPTVKEKLQREEEVERKRNLPSPTKKTFRLSRSTQDRLKDLKNKCSTNGKLSSGRSKNQTTESKNRINTKKSNIDRSKYPDLSDIKVKVGTDLDESLFDANEVAANARKFDNRIRNTRFGSQDDLDDIADLTSSTLDESETNTEQIDSSERSLNDSKNLNNSTAPVNKSFTNTVNSKEFQEYLQKKGLSLIPQSKPAVITNGNGNIINNTISSNYYDADDETCNEMDNKKVKKPSVLQRLFPNGLFSSKRKTTPKEPVPEPRSLTSKSTEDLKGGANNRRIILERQSFHGLTQLRQTASQPKERSKRPVGIISDDRSSSISSALTNAEYVDMTIGSVGHSPRLSTDSKTLPNNNNKENYVEMNNSFRGKKSNDASYDNIDSSRSSLGVRHIDSSGDSDRTGRVLNSLNTTKTTSGRSSVPLLPVKTKTRKDPPVSFDNRSIEQRDGIVKPKVQRPNIPISTLKPLPARHPLEVTAIPVKRQTSDRLSLKHKSQTEETPAYGYLNRSVSLDKNGGKKRIQTKENSASIEKTPTNSIEFLDGPKSTSTPISDTDKPKPNFNRQANKEKDDLSPISPTPSQPAAKPVHFVSKNKLELDAKSWAMLHDLKEKTDRQLMYSKPLTIQTDPQSVTESVEPRTRNSVARPQENIYEKVPRPTEQQQIVYVPIPANSFVRSSFQRCSLSQLPENPNENLNLQRIPIDYQNVTGYFARGGPQRNTIQGTVGSSPYRAIPIKQSQIQVQNQPTKIGDNSGYSQPLRSQSVLDNITTSGQYDPYGTLTSRNNDSIQLRRKQPPARQLTREEIMSKVTEFCRRSMNETPTKQLTGQPMRGSLAMSKTSSDISPVSYASLDSRTTGSQNGTPKVAPQVPQRVQSLPRSMQSTIKSNVSPIYTMVMKRDSLQSVGSEFEPKTGQRRIPLISESDSVFLHNDDNNKSPTQRPYLIMKSADVTPTQAIVYNSPLAGKRPPNLIQPIYGSRQSIDGRIYVQQESPYGYVHVPHQQQNPNLMKIVPNQQPQPQQLYSNRIRMDGRTTPLILHAVPQTMMQRPPNPIQRNGDVIVVDNQMYRPVIIPANRIVNGANHSPQRQHSLQRQIPLKSMQRLMQQGNGNGNIYHKVPYESESASEAEEVQRIMQNRINEEDWQNEKGRNQQNEQATDDRRRGGARREDPRRHTLGSDMLGYGPGQGPQRAMDLEMGTRAQKSKKAPPSRGYTPVNQGPLFDDDPGIMSEVETASTGFRRGGKQRSSLPVVRTPSKTLERPLDAANMHPKCVELTFPAGCVHIGQFYEALWAADELHNAGLVFLQYRSETKRALLPNEITSIDTVRALFVRSFPRQLTMAYLEGPNVKIYIHDASKDMFYELEDVRSHLREIRDRSVLRLFESNEVVAPQVLPGGPGVPQPLPQSGGHWDQDQSYFSEPEFDSEYQHQHIHKSKGGKTAPYYVGAAQTLPRGMYSDRNKNVIGAPAKPLRSYGSRGSMGPQFPYPPDQLYSIPDGYMSSPERGTRGGYEEPYYSQYGSRGGTVTPIIDEEQTDVSIADDQYSLYGHKVTGRIPRNANQMYDPTRPEDLHRIRVEHMERQLANLTGLVQKALTQTGPPGPVGPNVNQNYLGIPGQYREDMDGHSSGSSTSIQANGIGDDIYVREKPPKLGKSACHKSVSFEKSVSFSDDIQGTPKSHHNPQHPADSKPPKPAIKSSTLPRTSSQERDRLKPPPPPKPMGLAPTHGNYRPDIALAPEVYNHLRGLQKKAKDLRMEMRTLRRLSQAQAVAVREDIKDAFMGIRATLMASGNSYWEQGDQEKTRLSREEEMYKQEVIRLEKDLGDLESSVEGLRGEVINRRTRVNMAAVEDMALVLSRASKTVAELKMKFPGLQNDLRNILANEMEKVVREEKFLKDEPDRLESALRRCKKLTGTLVTLKRLASVQEQRLPVVDPPNDEAPRSAEVQPGNKPIPSPRLGPIAVVGGVAPENALDALLDELQTFAKPPIGINNNEARPDDSTSDDSSQTLQCSTITTQHSQSSHYPIDTLVSNSHGHGLRRLHSYPSGSDTDTSPPQPPRPAGKPPVPERNAELLSKVNNKRIPPPPPPRTSSRSPLASPTSPNISHRLPVVNESDAFMSLQNNGTDGGNSSGNESSNSQEQVQRQLALEMRHQELLKKQKQLQEQYARLQQMSKTSSLPPNDILMLKKTGSESNLPQKMGLNMAVSGSMKNLNVDVTMDSLQNDKSSHLIGGPNDGTLKKTTTKQVYETDIL